MLTSNFIEFPMELLLIHYYYYIWYVFFELCKSKRQINLPFCYKDHQNIRAICSQSIDLFSSLQLTWQLDNATISDPNLKLLIIQSQKMGNYYTCTRIFYLIFQISYYIYPLSSPIVPNNTTEANFGHQNNLREHNFKFANSNDIRPL